MESARTMTIHALLIAALLFVGMRFGLKQSKNVAETRSILAGALVLAYMIVWGHKLPSGKVNPLLK